MTTHDPEHVARFRLLEPFKSNRNEAPLGSKERLRAFLGRHAWFLAVVVLPSVLAGLYLFFIASDLYLSEARFIVRRASGESTSGIGGLLRGTGLAPAEESNLAIKDYIMSRDAVRVLEKEAGLRSILARPEGDFLAVFPRPLSGGSFEQLHANIDRYVGVTVDAASGISTLKVKTFRAEDSHKIAQALLAASEALVNNLNQRAQQDQMALAQREVARAEERVVTSQGAITRYRASANMLDPETGSEPVLELIGGLAAELASAQAQLSQTLATSPQSPQLGSLRERVRILENQIAQQQRTLVGSEKSIATKIAEYERLYLERQFADKHLASAMLSLEEARLRAPKEYVYLERIIEPNLADHPLYPRRLYTFLIVLVSVLLLYGIGRLVSASVKEHVGR